jgi:4-hydroxy-3-methylbut-2-en-1-yl diphosphate reductase
MDEIHEKDGQEARQKVGQNGRLGAIDRSFHTMRHSTVFVSETIDAMRASGNVLKLPAGDIRLPTSFGFCRGVNRALAMLEDACVSDDAEPSNLFLLGQIIHNPWVNDHFSNLGVRILDADQVERLEEFITPTDRAVIPAFGVTVDIERRLEKIGCEVLDTTCGDVRRLWLWACRAAKKGFGVLIFGRAEHDETVVTKSRLDAVGGKYVVAGDLVETGMLADMIAGVVPPEKFGELFSPKCTNAEAIEPFLHLAQVSQTTMLYSDTGEVRKILERAFGLRFGVTLGAGVPPERLLFEPTVCHATQDHQTSAAMLCSSGCDLVMVVGGFGSSNTRHLHELARGYAPAFFIENAEAIISDQSVIAFDPDLSEPVALEGWLPTDRPLSIGVLAGASSPEIVVGQVIERLAEFLR